MGKFIADFSHHQEKADVDWAKLSKVLSLAIIRVQYGSSKIDREYKNHVAGCKKYGIPFGHYAYGQFVSVADAIKEAEDFDERADKAAKFVVVDVEEQTCHNAADIVPATQAFIDTLRKKGWKKIGLYTGNHFYGPYHMNRVKADFVWIPRYKDPDKGVVHTSKPDYPCDIWQFTQCGKLDGVNGNVDLNVLTGSKPLSYFTGASEVVTKPVTPSSKGEWKKESGKWYYYVGGKKSTGWLKDKGKWYFLDSTGAMKTGWVASKGKWYYLGSDGAMKQGWIKYNAKWYYLNPAADKGEMVTGWLHDENHWYYLNPASNKGEMMTGKQVIGGKTYEFLANGQLKE